MATTSTSHAAFGLQDQLFSLPNEEPVTFLFHNFENEDLTKRIVEHGGRITDDDDDADVILTISREEYISLKDKYAISRKTHVRLSGFVDRCIDARRFQLDPIVDKGVPGRKLMSRRTEFTKDDDEHLCQYIAEVLPDKGEGGRTGHFIYADLIRRADEFGQYKWAHRHPEGGWRERYRKNRDRMDKRIAQIVEESPPPPDGKGRYMYRRNGKIDKDDELNADDEGLVRLDEEESRDSATDNEDSPVQIRIASAQRQEEEEEDSEGQAIMHRPEATYNLRSRNAKRQEEESTEGQTAKQRPVADRTRSSTRRSRVPLSEAPRPERRRTVDTKASFPKRALQATLEEPRNPNHLDVTSRGSTERDYDKPAEEFAPGPPPSNESEIRKGKVRARRVVPPLTPRRMRASSRSPSIQPEGAPGVSRTTSRAKAKAAVTITATAAMKPVPESQVFDEFVAYSDDGDDGEMHGVEDSDSETELFAHANKLSVLAPPVLAANLNRGGHRDRDQHSSSEEIFPSPGTRAGAEKKRRTQAAKAAPYVPPKGTRAASMLEKEQARSRQVAVTTQIKRKS